MTDQADGTALRRLLGNSGLHVAERGLQLGVNFFVVAIIARALGAEAFGAYSYVIAVTGIIQAAASLGLQRPLTGRFAAAADDAAALCRAAALLLLASGLCASLALLGFGLVTDERPTGLGLAFAAAALSFPAVVNPIVDAFFRARLRTGATVATRIAASLIAAALKLAIVAAAPSVAGLIAAIAVETALVFLGYAVAFRRFTGAWPIGPVPTSRLRELLGLAVGFAIIPVAVHTLARIDQVAVTWFIGLAENGAYAAAMRLAQIVQFAPAILVSFTIAVLAPIAADQRALLIGRTVALARLAMAGALLVTLATWLLAPWIVPLVFGDDFSAAIPLLRILSLLAPIGVLENLRINHCILLDARRMLLVTLGGALAINLVALPIAAAQYGTTGVALAMVATYLLSIFVLPLAFRDGRELIAAFGRVLIWPIPNLADLRRLG